MLTNSQCRKFFQILQLRHNSAESALHLPAMIVISVAGILIADAILRKGGCFRKNPYTETYAIPQ